MRVSLAFSELDVGELASLEVKNWNDMTQVLEDVCQLFQ